MVALNEKKLRSHRETLRTILDNEDEDKLLPRGRRESAGKVPSSEEEIDFWQVRMRARTTDIVACALVADGRRWGSAHVEP